MTSAGQFEPIMTLDDITPTNLLRFVSYNCSGDCTTKSYSCKKNTVKCISACGGCHSILCKSNEVEVPSSWKWLDKAISDYFSWLS